MQGDFTNERQIFLPVSEIHDAESFSLGPDALLLSYIMFLTVISLTGPGLGRSGKLRRNLKNFTTDFLDLAVSLQVRSQRPLLQ